MVDLLGQHRGSQIDVFLDKAVDGCNAEEVAETLLGFKALPECSGGTSGGKKSAGCLSLNKFCSILGTLAAAGQKRGGSAGTRLRDRHECSGYPTPTALALRSQTPFVLDKI